MIGALLLGVACDYGFGEGEGGDGGWVAEDFTGVEELAEPLTNLATPCAYATPSGVPTMTITLADNEIGVVSKRAVDGAMLVNGYACGDALATTLKRINVTGSTGTNTIILDFVNGTFATGYGSGAGTPGVVVDLVSGNNDAFKIRGYTSTDTVTFGADGVAWNTDTVKDATLANVDDIVVSLGAGNDTFSGSGGYGTGNAYAAVLTVYGGDGNDTISGGTAADVLNGGAGNDTLRGALDAALDVAADTLNGDAGTDTFDCGNATNGGDTMNGGADSDTVSYASRTNAVTVTMGAGANDGEALETDTIAADVEAVVGGGGADTLTGSANDDTISGGGGNDTITGGDGDDTLNGDAGDDTFVAGAVDDGSDVLNGGAGTDLADYSARSGDLTIDIDGTADDGLDGELDNVKTDVENITAGSGNDSLTGSSSANTFIGGDGDDTLNGGAGDDTFDEEAASNGADTFIGGTGTDTVDYSGRSGAITATMAGPADGSSNDDGEALETDDIRADVENYVGGTGVDTVTGNDLANRIEGGDDDDVLDGGAGSDELFGGAGDDDMDGGAGDDILDGGTDTAGDTYDCGAGEGDIAIYDSDETPTNCEL